VVEMKLQKIILISLAVTAFIVSLSYAEPKDSGEHEKGYEKNREKHLYHESLRELRQEKEHMKEFREICSKENRDEVRALRELIKEHREMKENAKWSFNPHDTRGQGNMGKPDMLDPYGRDKDSDRKELYGNRGRVIKTDIPEPEPPVPEPPAPEPEPPAPEPPINPPVPPIILRAIEGSTDEIISEKKF